MRRDAATGVAPRCDGVVRAGVDLVAVEEVRQAIERFGEAYLSRVFTDHERASCVGSPLVVAGGLAARLAAKEAAIKVLEPPAGAPAPEWRAIEVRRRASGGCELALHGSAAYLASRGGIASLAVSLSHEGAMACAVVVALGSSPQAPIVAELGDAREQGVGRAPGRPETRSSSDGRGNPSDPRRARPPAGRRGQPR